MEYFVDEAGNRLVSLNGKWELVLKDKPRRMLGVLKDGTFSTSRKRDKHVYRRLDAYGFCDVLFDKLPKGTRLKITDEKGVYIIPVDKVNKNKIYDSFEKSEGFEKQAFLDIDFIEKHKMKA